MLYRVVWAVPSEGQQNVLKEEEGRAWSRYEKLAKGPQFPSPLTGKHYPELQVFLSFFPQWGWEPTS